MSENLRRRADEKDIGFAHVAPDAYPYVRYKVEVEGKEVPNVTIVLAFMVIEDMPTVVTLRPSSDGKDGIVQWHGFWKGNWYTDFASYSETELKDPATLQAAADKALVQAEELLLNDLKEPAA